MQSFISKKKIGFKNLQIWPEAEPTKIFFSQNPQKPTRIHLPDTCRTIYVTKITYAANKDLLKEFESRFNQTMDLGRLTREELEDYANKVRTRIHEITQNTHFG